MESKVRVVEIAALGPDDDRVEEAAGLHSG
jgi:hypothetical protein